MVTNNAMLPIYTAIVGGLIVDRGSAGGLHSQPPDRYSVFSGNQRRRVVFQSATATVEYVSFVVR